MALARPFSSVSRERTGYIRKTSEQVQHTSEHFRRVSSRCVHGPDGISVELPVDAVLALRRASRQKVRWQDFWAFILALREVSKPSI